ncbi:hypothetical protein [Microbaculum marinum]|uniref:Uncharacterized protein n=1 Tax=Microbaculum marinum TaxID=1764581 RepID=A0AAW9RUJ5_9HYPH
MSDRHVWHSRIASVAAAGLLAANLAGAAQAAGPILAPPQVPDNEAPVVRVSKTGDKVAAGVAGAVVGGLIGAAVANSDKNRSPGYYPPPYAPQPAPGYYPPPAPPPPQYGSDAAWRTCVAYGNKYSQKSGALGLRLDNIVSIQPRGYNTFVVSAYMSVLWPNYQARSYVTCTVTNGTVTSWLVA